MIASLDREDLVGERIVVGGPQALLPSEVADILSTALGRKIAFEYISPRQFGEVMYDIFGDVSPLDRETYAGALEAFYDYNNALDGRPFQVDMAPVLERIPVSLTSLSEWAKEQDWALRNDGPSGG